MASYVPRTVTLEPTLRGDVWPGFVVTINKSGQDFSGCVAICQLRQRPDSEVVATLTVTLVAPALGTVTLSAGADGSATATWPPGTLYGDVELYRTSPAFGPRTYYRFAIEVYGDISHA